jgi:hypothetical protein
MACDDFIHMLSVICNLDCNFNNKAFIDECSNRIKEIKNSKNNSIKQNLCDSLISNVKINFLLS